jgi:endonuclease/exonuclease/phosphatase (EEP) superfamily protein YafD
MRRFSKWTLALLALAIAWLVAGRPDATPAPPAADVFRVATANVHYDNPKAAEATAALSRSAPHVLIVLEWTGRNLDHAPLIAAGYVRVLSEPRNGTHGLALFARRDLPAEASILPAPVPGPCALPIGTARVTWKGSALSLIAVHAPPPVPGCKGANAPSLRAVASWIERGRMRRDVGSARKDDPVIVAGDLNAFPFAEGVRALKGVGLVDTFAALRTRPGPTWAPFVRYVRLPALARIDYVLASSLLEPVAAWSLATPGSDHRTVVADLRRGSPVRQP